MESNNKVIVFVLAMCLIVASLLAGLYIVTKPIADKNEAIFNKREILKAVEAKLDNVKVADISDEEVLKIFDNQVVGVAVNSEGDIIEGVVATDIKMEKEVKKDEADMRLPFYTFTQGSEKYYIVSVRGKGLWDAIWGNIAIASDLNTVVGASFDHKGETPGLGAEIKDNPAFPKSFRGKKLFNDAGEFVSIEVKKGGAEKGNAYQVDAISGATVTGVGVDDMLEKGISHYLAYFDKVK